MAAPETSRAISVEVNGEQIEMEVEARRLLVHFIRDDLGLTGTHIGCDTGNCGACTVHFDGEPVKSCMLLAVQADGSRIATVEGLAELFAATGFRLSVVHREETSMRFLDGSALLRHYFIKLGFLEGWKSVLAAADQPAVFARLEENLNRLAEGRGELLLTIPMAYVEATREANPPA